MSESSLNWKTFAMMSVAGGGVALLIWQTAQIRKMQDDCTRLREELRTMHEEMMDRVERRLATVPSGDQLEKLTRIPSGFLQSVPSWTTQSICSDDMYDDANEEWYNSPIVSPPSSSLFDPSSSSAGDAPALTQVAMDALDKLIDDNPQKAYDDMKKMYSEGSSKDAEVLWRLAKACHCIAGDYDRKNPKKKELILEGRGYAQSAASINDTKFIIVKWAAILTGSATDHVGMKEKIEQGSVFKAYLDKALAMDAKEYSLLHMRGRYAFSVANLSWLERKAAAAFFATPPEATIDEALRDFLAANTVRGKWIENLVYIARCYITKKDSKNAVLYLNEALSVAPTDDSEKELLEEARGLVKKHGG
ncbi:hypothetical protein PFISCL1PPCAC_1826 [Pristionchus fissidentatus]|uniref:Uncharacterized protein n=1 Tax=Pristionchus fissidentatus TaxID=1538716 RepID=A0AAV5UW23_9BILA|nr:hypothetical protein PFISCL1PPCAC_1826 [Pristionchus fissidentatus]